MKRLISIATSLVLASAAVCIAMPAEALEPTTTPESVGSFSQADVSKTIDALSTQGKLVSTYRTSNGGRVSTIDLGSGAAVTVTEPAPARTRLSEGNDSGGFYVSSNAGSCPGGKSLRVWVTNTGARNPKCV